MKTMPRYLGSEQRRLAWSWIDIDGLDREDIEAIEELGFEVWLDNPSAARRKCDALGRTGCSIGQDIHETPLQRVDPIGLKTPENARVTSNALETVSGGFRVSNRGGRPRKYANNTAKCRAYRERKREREKVRKKCGPSR